MERAIDAKSSLNKLVQFIETCGSLSNEQFSFDDDVQIEIEAEVNVPQIPEHPGALAPSPGALQPAMMDAVVEIEQNRCGDNMPTTKCDPGASILVIL